MEKSEALRLADAIEKAIRPEASLPLGDWARAAAELRRLSAVEAQRDALLEALQDLCDTLGECGMTERARGTIEAVEGENHAKSL